MRSPSAAPLLMLFLSQLPVASPLAQTAVPAAAPAPAKEPTPHPGTPGQLTLAARLFRDGSPVAEALLAAAQDSLTLRNRLDEKAAPLSWQRYEARRLVLGQLGRRVQWWATQQQQIEQRQERLRQMTELGTSTATARLQKEIESMQKDLADSKATWRDVPDAGKPASKTILAVFFVDAARSKPPRTGRPSRRSVDHNPVAASMETVRDTLAMMLAGGVAPTEQRLVGQLNECCQRIAQHAVAGKTQEAQELCDAVVAWMLDDSMPLPGS